MSPDILEAAARLRRVIAGESLYDVYSGITETITKLGSQWFIDRAIVANAVLEELDPTPLTEEWFASVGGEPMREGGPHWWHRGIPGLMWDRRDGVLMHGNSATGWNIIAEQATRGHVRRYAAGVNKSESLISNHERSE